VRRLALTLALFALGAAACGNGDGGEAGAGGGKATVGLLYTTSGQGGELAQAALGTAELVTADAEADGIELKVVSADYGGEARQVQSMTQQLVDKGASGIVVATDDPDVARALRDFDEVPLLYAQISEDDAVGEGTPAFRLAPSNRLQARKMADYLVDDRGYERIAILHDNTPFGREGAADLRAALGPLGADVVMDWEFKPGGDIHTPVMYAGQQSAQALVLWAQSAAEAGRITIEIQKAGQSYQLALSGSLATADYGKNASSQVVPVAFRDGVLSVGTWAGPWFADAPKIGAFFSRFKSEQNALAPVQALQIYDGLLLLAGAAAADPDPVAVVRALERTRDFEGAGAPLSFSAQSHEGVGLEDMAMWGFTRSQESAGGEFFPAVDTGGGFFTIIPASAQLPEKYSYLVAELPGA
jgi:ABC-type branched-subunit amino acid transport system substrate-binding protein